MRDAAQIGRYDASRGALLCEFPPPKNGSFSRNGGNGSLFFFFHHTYPKLLPTQAHKSRRIHTPAPIPVCVFTQITCLLHLHAQSALTHCDDDVPPLQRALQSAELVTPIDSHVGESFVDGRGSFP